MALITISLKDITQSLYGAFRLAKGDKTGLSYFNTTYTAFWKSFYALILIAPVFCILLIVKYDSTGENISSIRFGSIYIITYIIGWVAFPLIVFHILNFTSMGDKFIRYIVAYNWASVLQNFIYLPFAILVEARIFSGFPATIIGLILLSIVLVYTWFITKVALETTNIFVTSIVIIDLFLSIFLSSISQGMIINI